MTPQEQREFQKQERNLRRCIFFFADGRRCSMERLSDTEQLCRYHFEQKHTDEKAVRSGRKLVGSKPGALETAIGINHTLENILRAVAERRIPAKDAATIAYICQLLLTSIPLMQKEIALYARSGARCLDYAVEPEFKNPEWMSVLYSAFKPDGAPTRHAELVCRIRERLASEYALQVPSNNAPPHANGAGAAMKSAASKRDNGNAASNGNAPVREQKAKTVETASTV
jgi:hypothetical protein